MDKLSVNQYTYGGVPVRQDAPLKPNNPLNPDYYTRMKITPTEYITKNNIPWREANVIKYVSRWRGKNGIEDLRKARVYINQLIAAAEEDE
jgi:hypothetical protein